MKEFTFDGIIRYELIQKNRFIVYAESEEDALLKLKKFDWSESPIEIESSFGKTLSKETEEIVLINDGISKLDS